MHRPTRLVRVATRDWCLLFESVGFLLIVRVALWIIPYRTLRRILMWLAGSSERIRRSDPNVGHAQRVAWAIDRTRRCVPRANCLTQALAAQAMLARAGQAGILCLGVARDGQGSIRAHAWLEVEGQVLVGGSVEQYTPLAPLGSDPAAVTPQ